jgi:hypothetical protein
MKKKRGLTIKINLSNRYLYTFIFLGILAIIGVSVYALTPGVKPNPGHLLSEVAPPAGCSVNQSLIWNGTDIICGPPSSLPSTPNCVVSLTGRVLRTSGSCLTDEVATGIQFWQDYYAGTVKGVYCSQISITCT